MSPQHGRVTAKELSAHQYTRKKRERERVRAYMRTHTIIEVHLVFDTSSFRNCPLSFIDSLGSTDVLKDSRRFLLMNEKKKNNWESFHRHTLARVRSYPKYTQKVGKITLEAKFFDILIGFLLWPKSECEERRITNVTQYQWREWGELDA